MTILKNSNMASFNEFGSICLICFLNIAVFSFDQTFSKSLEVKSCLHE